MGREIQFLERLGQISRAHVELALSLNHDPLLVEVILAEAGIPEGAARVASALGPPDIVPFLVVGRKYHLLTCLGEWMHPGDLPVISFLSPNLMSARIDSLRDQSPLANA